jgi:hypothetical protein
MKAYKIERTGEKALKFTGELLGADTTETGVGTKTRTEIYKTGSGKWVAFRKHLTQWQGCKDTCEARVCSSEAEVIEFLGQDESAQYCYANAEIDNSEEV